MCEQLLKAACPIIKENLRHQTASMDRTCSFMWGQAGPFGPRLSSDCPPTARPRAASCDGQQLSDTAALCPAVSRCILILYQRCNTGVHSRTTVDQNFCWTVTGSGAAAAVEVWTSAADTQRGHDDPGERACCVEGELNCPAVYRCSATVCQSGPGSVLQTHDGDKTQPFTQPFHGPISQQKDSF